MLDQLEFVEMLSEENKRRKRKRIVLTKLFVETCALALAFVTTQRNRGPMDLGTFNDDEDKIRNRKYLLKCMYDGSVVACYDQLCLTKRNFHDLCTMLRERCGLCDSVYVTVEEKVPVFLLVVDHSIKMRMLCGTYKRSLWTISTHFSAVLNTLLSLHGEFIKLP
uniref:DUF8040 domain-containing protein n=2 Tax=Aegilops tauschii subsp. strangulata TaxID=200361 RepID=A0A453LRC2_AEGTS